MNGYEKTIDDLFFEKGIAHEKEPYYPGAQYRADWKIRVGEQEVYVELFGLDGRPDYTKRKKIKLAYAQEIGMRMIAIERKDLSDLRKAFQMKIMPLFESMSSPNPAG